MTHLSSETPPHFRLAIVHDWLTGRRGGEKVLEDVLEVWPDADIYTLIQVRGAVPTVERVTGPIRTTWIDRIPAKRRLFQLLLPWFNNAMGAFDLSGYDAVISVSHCCAKNVRVPTGVVHLCYCLSPIRYGWDLFDLYTARYLAHGPGLWLGLAARCVRDRLRRQDLVGNRTVTAFFGIARFIQARIARCYGRDSGVIFPPVDVAAFEAAAAARDRAGDAPSDRFLVISAVRRNKRVAEIAEAFRELGLPLDVVGSVTPRARRELAQRGGPTVTVHGVLPDETLQRMVARCRALVHAATEDFGIVPVEAMAAGRPAIGYRHCGMGETIVDGETGVLFDEPTPKGIGEGVRRFLAIEDRITPAACHARARRFSRARFRAEIREALHSLVAKDAKPAAR